MSNLNEVIVRISGEKTGDIYYAKSYPDKDFDNDGKFEYYSTDVYKIFIESGLKKKEWTCLRFMPFWNDPDEPYTKYRARGWVNSGLSSKIVKKQVTLYDRNYTIQNTVSEYYGAIQIRGNFLIHAGPPTLESYGWGAAGCIEVIGNFSHFLEQICLYGNTNTSNVHDGMKSLVDNKKLFVSVDYAPTPNLKENFFKEQ